MRRSVSIGVIWFMLQIAFVTLLFADDVVQLEAAQVSRTSSGSRITLQASRPIAVITYTLNDPDRLIVDPAESSLRTMISPSQIFHSAGLIQTMQLSMDQDVVDYLTFIVSEPVRATVYQAGQLVTIEVVPVSKFSPTVVTEKPPVSSAPPLRRERSVAPPRPLTSAKPSVPVKTTPALKPQVVPSIKPPAAPRAPVFPSLPVESGPLTPSRAIDQALAVYEPARIALEETELAMRKVREARRNLFPGASLRGSYTTGKASAEFREQRAGIQVEHPLYDAGRLRDAYKQALVNLQISQKRYEKVRADFAFEVAQAYFDLMAARQSVGYRERLLRTAEEIFESTRRRFAAGLVTRMEFLNVQSQLSQARFQAEGARNDLAVAELKFRHRMNLEAPLPMTLPEQFPPAGARVELAEALRTAAWQRPDMQINTLLVEFHRYEERLAQKKSSWKLDLTGFAGESGGAFKTEPLPMNRDYSVALKMSKIWGGSTASVTGTKSETSAQVGQTSRTASNSLQGELGILNALSGRTEIEQAHIGWMKAAEDLAETRQTLAQEVHEAYYAYHKAELTLQHAQQKEQFRTEQVKILRAQAELNEILPSQLLEAELQLSDDQISQIQAQAGYHTALARLNKAIGMTGYYGTPIGGGT